MGEMEKSAIRFHPIKAIGCFRLQEPFETENQRQQKGQRLAVVG